MLNLSRNSIWFVYEVFGPIINRKGHSFIKERRKSFDIFTSVTKEISSCCKSFSITFDWIATCVNENSICSDFVNGRRCEKVFRHEINKNYRGNTRTVCKLTDIARDFNSFERIWCQSITKSEKLKTSQNFVFMKIDSTTEFCFAIVGDN